MMHQGASGTLEPGDLTQNLSDEFPVLALVADIEARVVLNLDSGDMQPAQWVRIGQAVHEALSSPEVDGVVVVHGTDTMAYTASAVAFLLGPVPKPVVFTGAQRPLSEVRTDARANLVDACIIATMAVPEVGIAFASRFFRGVRATKRDAWALDAFDSPSLPCLVDLGIGEALSPHMRPGGPLGPFDPRLNEHVLVVRVFPGLDPGLLSRALAEGVRGLVLEGYGTGNLPHKTGSLIPVLEQAARREAPVLVVSQCFKGGVELSHYRGGAAARSVGAISGGDMTVEASVVKMMVALGRYERIEDIRAFLEADIAGERSS